jgi:hypothetical protein
MTFLPQMSLGSMMGLVAWIAVHVALTRATTGGDFELPVVCGLPVILLELAAWRAWRDRRPGRAFWLGYLALGGLVTGSLVWAGLHGPTLGRLPDGTFAVIRPASGLNLLWRDAFLAVARRALPYFRALEAVPGAQLVLVLGLVFAPQLGAGWIGGRIGRSVGSRLAADAAGPEGASPASGAAAA